MFISASDLTFYKTPLDTNYRNVFDGFASIAQYKIFLDNNYPNKAITLNTSRGVKSINRNFAITIPGLEADFSDYNYCAIYARNKYYFFFVIGIESQNDDRMTVNASCTLTLKYDSWANNYVDYISKSKKKSFVKRMTVNEHKIVNGKLHMIPFSTNEPEIPTIINSMQNIKPSQQAVLWMKVKILREKVDIYTPAGNIPSFDRQYTSFTSGEYYIVYYPVCLIDYNGFQTGKNIFENVDFSWKGHEGLDLNMKSYDDRYTFLTSDIISAQLTYHSPIKYEITNTSPHKTVSITGLGVRFNPTSDKNIPVVALQKDRTMFATGFIVSGEDQYTNEKISSWSPSISGIYYGQKYVADALKDKGVNVFRLKQYPYEYRTIKTSENEIPIIGLRDYVYSGSSAVSDSIYDVYVNLTSDGAPLVQITSNNTIKSIGTVKPFTVSSNGNVVVAFDNYTQFMRSSGNSVQAQEMALMLRLLSGATTYGIKTATNPGGIGRHTANEIDSITNIAIAGNALNAKLSDIQNIPDTVAINGNASDYLFNQDNIYVVEYCPMNTFDYDKLKNALYETGYTIAMEENPVAINRSAFDYSETSGAELPIIPNIQQRQEIENALNAGMTRWHVLVPVNGVNYTNNFDDDFLQFVKNQRNYDIAELQFMNDMEVVE